MQEAFGFEIGPEFKTIFGQGIVISGFVVVSEGVHVLAAILLDDLSEFVRTEMAGVLLDDPRLSADNLAKLLSER